ncbi:MAG: hypothetical protein ACE5EA_08300 [Nitrospirota bacterium]
MSYTLIYKVEEISEVLTECINIEAYHKNSVKRLLRLRAYIFGRCCLYGFPCGYNKKLACLVQTGLFTLIGKKNSYYITIEEVVPCVN